MKRFRPLIIEIALIFSFLVCVQISTAQNKEDWGLKKLRHTGHQWSSTNQHMVMKAKYTSRGFRSVLYNSIVFYNNLPLLPDNNHFEAGDYQNWYGGGGMSIKKDTSLLLYSYSNDYTYQIGVKGSTSNYAKDYETDGDDNFILLADNRGNGWNPENPVSSNKKDSTQLLLCKISQKDELTTKVHWHKLYGGSNAEYAVAIRKAPDGNFIVLAQTQSGDGDVTGYHGSKDIWLLKIKSSNGDIVWQKTIGTTSNEVPTDLEILDDGSIIISGSAEASDLFPGVYGGFNAFLLKADQNGDLLWTKVFGGSGSDKIHAFVPIAEGYVSISASNSNDGDFPVNNGRYDTYITRHDVSGNIVWNKHYGSASNDIPGDIAFIKCDSTIYASFSKKFDGISGGQYPAYSRHAGIRVGIKSDGIQSYYFQDVFFFNDQYDLSNFLTPSIVANNKGGIFTTNITHHPQLNVMSRSFETAEYGNPVKIVNRDTLICKGQTGWGHTYFIDTTFADTLRNTCGVDTVINKYSVRIRNEESNIARDTIICYGSKFDDSTRYHSFIAKDTLTENTPCGPRLVITTTHAKVTPPIVNSFGSPGILCPNQEVELKAFTPALKYLWQDGSYSASHIVNNAGLYWVEVIDTFGCRAKDSIAFTMEPVRPVQKIYIDTAFCKGQQAWGNVYERASSFADTLRNGCGIDTMIRIYSIHISNADSIIVRDTTICYGTMLNDVPVFETFSERDTITLAHSCGARLIISIKNIHVTTAIPDSFDGDVLLCKNEALRLNAYSPAKSYIWQDGSVLPLFAATKPGLYWVEITDTAGCKSIDSILLRESDLYLADLPDTTISISSSILLSPPTNGTIIWQNDPTLSCIYCQTTQATPGETNIYRLSAEKDNCRLEGQIKVIVNTSFYLHVPNSFTPNKDNLNDYFRVQTNLSGTFLLEIYNRYGEKVFSSTSPLSGWDGRFKGVPQPAGNYVYTLRYNQGNSGVRFLKGKIILLR